MARAELEDLYRILVDARFEFIPVARSISARCMRW